MADQSSRGSGSSFLSGLCGLLAIVLLPVSLVAFWASVMLTRTDVFVEELSPVVQKPLVQVVQLRPAIEKALAGPIRVEAAKLVASPAVETAWTAGIRQAHVQFVRVMEGKADTELDSQGRVALDVKLTVPALTATLTQAGVPDAGALAPVITIPLVKAADLEKAQTAYRIADAWGPWSPVVVAALALLSIFLARRWRAAATLVAFGWIVVSLALALMLMISREPLLRRLDSDVARTVADAAYGLAARNLYYEIAIAVGVAVLLLLVAGLSLAFRRRRAA